MSELLPSAISYLDRVVSPVRGGMKNPPRLYAYRHRAISLMRRRRWNFAYYRHLRTGSIRRPTNA